MTIFHDFPLCESSLGTENRGSWMSRNTMALVNPPPLLKSRRSYCDYLWLVKHRERMGKGCSVVWKCLKLRSPPRKSAPPAVPRCDGFTEMQSWKDNYDLRCVHSSKNAVKHSQTRGPKDTIKSNIWMMYIGWNMLKHKGVSRPPRYWSSWRWRQRSVHCQGKHGVHDDLLPSVAICCHLLPSVAIGRTTVKYCEDLNMNCLGSKLWVSQLHSQLTTSLVAPVGRNGSVGSVRHTVSQSWPSSRTNRIAWKKQPTVECNLAKVIQHRLVHTANQLPSATLITGSCHQDTLVTVFETSLVKQPHGWGVASTKPQCLRVLQATCGGKKINI